MNASPVTVDTAQTIAQLIEVARALRDAPAPVKDRAYNSLRGRLCVLDANVHYEDSLRRICAALGY